MIITYFYDRALLLMLLVLVHTHKCSGLEIIIYAEGLHILDVHGSDTYNHEKMLVNVVMADTVHIFI